MLRAAAEVAGVQFAEPQLDAMLAGVNENLAKYRNLRKVELDNSVAPPLYFNPIVPGMKIDRTKRAFQMSAPPRVSRPQSLEDAAFWPVTHLAELIRSKQVSSVELTEMYLGRLKRYNPRLLCAVNLTEDLALRQARQADHEIAAGRYRGPLHGIPYGIKDLAATKGYPTTWGAAPFKDRIIDMDATVVTRLNAAGAVLVAKLATGELALDDIWFGGPQGSSAGPASATAAGLVGFSIGTETGGSIVEPSGICGVTGLRPTAGRVSRYGFMTLTWSLDKIGPMCRSVEDCAMVLNAIQGPDDTHQTPQVDANDGAALAKIRSLGVELVEVALPEHADLDIGTIIYGEGNAALHDPIETRPQNLARQDRVANQHALRLLPAVEYLNANRIRTLLMQEMAEVMSNIDVYVVPFDYSDYTPNPVASLNTSVTNLTGNPCVLVPHGFNEKGNPTSLTFIGKLFGEAEMLGLAYAYQNATEWHLKHPNLRS